MFKAPDALRGPVLLPICVPICMKQKNIQGAQAGTTGGHIIIESVYLKWTWVKAKKWSHHLLPMAFYNHPNRDEM